MLDIALLTANASQLKYVLQVIEVECQLYQVPIITLETQVGAEHQFYTVLLTLIVTSIVFQVFFLKYSSFELVVLNIGFLQILAGILFLVLAGLNINDAKHHKSATILNNVAVAVIFVITVLNVIISTFGVQQNDIN